MSALLWFLAGLMTGLAIGGFVLQVFARRSQRAMKLHCDRLDQITKALTPKLHPRQVETLSGGDEPRNIFGGGQRKQ